MIKHVLCVDDEQVTQMLNQVIFKRTGFCENVVTALNGKLGLDYFEKLIESDTAKETVPQVILLDLNMPVIDGWEFLDKFKQQYHNKFPEISIFILSSSVDPKDMNKAAANSLVKGFVNKPLTIDAIEQLKNHIDLKQYFI